MNLRQNGPKNLASQPSAASRVLRASQPPKSPARWTLLALVLGLVLRLWFILHDARIAGDTLVYGAIARNWMLHNVYGWVERAGVPQPTLIRLPGYPLFLVACFRLFGIANYSAVLYLQAAFDLLACLLISALAGRLFGPRCRLLTLFLAAVCPFTASYVAAPLTETLTLACIVLAFYALHRWQTAGARFNRWLFVLAAALACALLLRPEQGLLAAAILPAMLWIALHPAPSGLPIRPQPHAEKADSGKEHDRTLQQGLAPVLLVALLTLLPLVPWALRNAHAFHVFQPLAPRYATDPGEPIPFGFQRWFRTWATDFASTEDVYWNYDGAAISQDDIPNRAFDTPEQRAATLALLADYNPTANATPALDDRWNALARERIAVSPLRYYVALPFARLLDMALRPRTEMFATPLEWWRLREHPQETFFALAYAALNLVYFILAARGAVLWHRTGHHRPLLYAMLASIALRATLLLTLDNSEPRYTLEFFPIFFLLAALPLTRTTEAVP